MLQSFGATAVIAPYAVLGWGGAFLTVVAKAIGYWWFWRRPEVKPSLKFEWALSEHFLILIDFLDLFHMSQSAFDFFNIFRRFPKDGTVILGYRISHFVQPDTEIYKCGSTSCIFQQQVATNALRGIPGKYWCAYQSTNGPFLPMCWECVLDEVVTGMLVLSDWLVGIAWLAWFFCQSLIFRRGDEIRVL